MLDAAGPESYTTALDAIDPSRTYRVATTDYVAQVAYKDLFACEVTRSGSRAREETRGRIAER